jgi:hypothetical protein
MWSFTVNCETDQLPVSGPPVMKWAPENANETTNANAKWNPEDTTITNLKCD